MSRKKKLKHPTNVGKKRGNPQSRTKGREAKRHTPIANSGKPTPERTLPRPSSSINTGLSAQSGAPKQRPKTALNSQSSSGDIPEPKVKYASKKAVPKRLRRPAKYSAPEPVYDPARVAGVRKARRLKQVPTSAAIDAVFSEALPDPLEVERVMYAKWGMGVPEPTDAMIAGMVRWVKGGVHPETAARMYGIGAVQFAELQELGHLNPESQAARLVRALDVADAQDEAADLQMIGLGAKNAASLEWKRERKTPQRWGPKAQVVLSRNRPPKELENGLGEDDTAQMLVLLEEMKLLAGAVDTTAVAADAGPTNGHGHPEPAGAEAYSSPVA